MYEEKFIRFFTILRRHIVFNRFTTKVLLRSLQGLFCKPQMAQIFTDCSYQL